MPLLTHSLGRWTHFWRQARVVKDVSRDRMAHAKFVPASKGGTLPSMEGATLVIADVSLGTPHSALPSLGF